MVEVGQCKHEELEFIGIQEVLHGEPLRLYNCKRCHTTVSRPGEFESEAEAQRWADRSFSSLPFGSAWEVQEKKEE